MAQDRGAFFLLVLDDNRRPGPANAAERGCGFLADNADIRIGGEPHARVLADQVHFLSGERGVDVQRVAQQDKIHREGIRSRRRRSGQPPCRRASFRTPSMKSRSARNLSFIPIDSLLVKENSAGKGAALPSSPLRTLGNGGRGWGRGNFPSERFPRPFSMQFTCSPPTRSACGRRNRCRPRDSWGFCG